MAEVNLPVCSLREVTSSARCEILSPGNAYRNGSPSEIHRKRSALREFILRCRAVDVINQLPQSTVIATIEFEDEPRHVR